MNLPMAWCLCLVIWMQSFTAVAGVLASPVQVAMRNHGYTLGDTMDMRVSITLQKGQVLDINSVPLKGPVNSWLDLREINVTQANNKLDQSQVELHFAWQIFATVEHTQMLKIPAIALKTLADKPVNIIIPAQGFYMSSVLPKELLDSHHRPFIPPTKFDTQTPFLLATLSLLGAFFFGGAWLWLNDKLPWCPRNPGPIALLERRLRSNQLSKSHEFNLTDLRHIHAALSSSAGETLYPNTLSKLYHQCPYLGSYESEITSFFQQSWLLIFEEVQDKNVERLSVLATLHWIHHAALSERLFRRQTKLGMHNTYQKARSV